MELMWNLLAVLYFFVPAYVANMAPVLAKGHVEWLAHPLDGGAEFRGRRVLGDHKTWRGLVAGILAGGGAFAVQRLVYEMGWLQSLALVDYGDASPWLGVLLGLGAIVGDALKSFAKRQMDIRPGDSWIVFDQLDFMAGAYLFAATVHAPPLASVLAILPVVFVGGVLTNSAGFRLGLKESWI
jgi:CDP-2,3-bis-(O-geranylgeranyl)-sn-glycerol synthase